MENQNLNWYVVHTFSAYESAVKSALEKMIENNNLHDRIVEISIPVEEDIVERNGKRKVVERKKFPRYIFLKMIYDDNLGYMIRNIHGCSGFVGPQGKALALTQDEIKRMGLEKMNLEDFDITVGDNVRIVSGPFETFMGIVESVDADKEKVKVMVQMFGRTMPVELDFNQIEKL